MLRAVALVSALLVLLPSLAVWAEDEGPSDEPAEAVVDVGLDPACGDVDAGAVDATPEPDHVAADVGVVDVGLDPGHSNADVGAVGGGLREVDLTLAVALRVRDLLQENGFTVAMSRLDNQPLTDFSARDPTTRIRLEQEARIAAVGNARMYVSIHFNGFGDPAVRGAESYYNGENHGSESRLLARSIQGSLVSEVRAAGYAVPDRGVKEDLWAGKPYGHFFSLRGDLPSVLVESMFLSNPREAALLADEQIREAVARGIAAGIAQYISAMGDAHAP